MLFVVTGQANRLQLTGKEVRWIFVYVVGNHCWRCDALRKANFAERLVFKLRFTCPAPSSGIVWSVFVWLAWCPLSGAIGATALDYLSALWA